MRSDCAAIYHDWAAGTDPYAGKRVAEYLTGVNSTLSALGDVDSVVLPEETTEGWRAVVRNVDALLAVAGDLAVL